MSKRSNAGLAATGRQSLPPRRKGRDAADGIEVAPRESRDLLRAILRTAVEAIVTIAADGTILSFNAAAERMFGYRPGEAIGKNVSMLMPSPHRQRHDAYIRRYLRTGNSKIIGTTRELTARRKDGSTFPIEISVSQVDDLPLFTGLVRDISERKRAERRDWEHQVELAHALRVATVGELASGLAHELNQPLMAISNDIEACLSRIRSGTMDAKHLMRPLEHASEEALRAGAIVHSVRDMVEKRPPRYGPVDLREPIRRACALVGGRLERFGVELRVEGMEERVSVGADGIQITQVLINLLQNAIDAVVDAGVAKPRLTVSLARADRSFARVRVRDNGRGVAAPAAEKLFDPFYSTKPRGLGVGLSLSRTVIETHGGKLVLEANRRGRRGATFCFTLPLFSSKLSTAAGRAAVVGE
jgi:two-component system, LuxR family, sensor kinase FixL